MLLDVKLRVDLFGNHYIVLDDKLSVKLYRRDYEDISYLLMKKEKENGKKYHEEVKEIRL